jgi:pimeloyl-ACP methyl ester carboxylesterase
MKPKLIGRADANGVEVEAGVEVLGLPVSYSTAGEGPPLVLLHGAGSNRLDWLRVLPLLARTRRVYAPDLPGFDGGPAPRGGYAAAVLARYVLGFMDELGLERAALVGNSLGGLVALRMALAEPGRVDALGLVDTAGFGRAVSPALASLTLPGYGEAAILWTRTSPGSRQRAPLRAALLLARPALAPAYWLEEQRRLARTPGFMEATLAALRAQLAPWGQREVVLDELPRLEMPALVLWGMQDAVFPVYQAEHAAGRIPDGRLVLLPGCGHLPQVDKPEEFADAVGRFLDEKGRGLSAGDENRAGRHG